jgi:Lipoprotein LpqB beta-propeller domain/Sporulation and spore germination
MTGRAIVAVVALALLGGCADLPSSGPVEWVVEERVGAEPLPLIDPPPPRAGANPAEIVNGFYEAMRAFPLSTEVAVRYLTSDAAEDWVPSRRTIVYDTMQPQWSGGTVVAARFGRRAVLSERGTYRSVGTGLEPEIYQYQLRLEDGEWRIANPANALFIDGSFFTQYYEPVSLYYVAPSGDYLVPDPIYLPSGDQLPTSLVRGLLLGPTRDLANQVQTAIPPMTQPEPSVPVDENGVADVRLAGPILDLGEEQQQLLAAQVVWTLAQVTTVSGVRITVSGVPLEFPGIPPVQTAQQWSTYDPSAVPARRSSFALEAGRIVQVTPQRLPTTRATSGWWGRSDRDVGAFGVSLDLSRVGAVSGDGRRLLLGPLSDPDRRPRTVYSSRGTLRSPTFTNSGELLVVENRATGSRLLAVGRDGMERPIPFRLLRDQTVLSLALSPDGTRFVAPVRDDLGVARIMLGQLRYARAGATVVSVTRVHELVATGLALQSIQTASWLDSTSVVVLGQVGLGPVRPYTVRIDGSQFVDPPLPVAFPRGLDATDLEASGVPDRDIYVEDEQGLLYLGGTQRWQLVDQRPLRAVTFPG